jgi:hypothetical protein
VSCPHSWQRQTLPPVASIEFGRAQLALRKKKDVDIVGARKPDHDTE